ncbi:YMGG-like glycine zipper-containing protein [Terrarubrum flagellatum]|uniref:YMGG-like glycine zipper-containing protein n=1 Tax=Terrirubrum flagellatum TaxID=2895980 RepID=UPI0031452E0E
MAKFMGVAMVALALAGCGRSLTDRMLAGAAIGGGAGAAIGAVSTGTLPGALVGAAIGAAGGAAIGALVQPQGNYAGS